MALHTTRVQHVYARRMGYCNMIHDALSALLVTEETLYIGARITQPYCVLGFGENQIAYVDLGKIDSWSEDICDERYALGLAELLKSYDARLMLDDNGNGLVAEIPSLHDAEYLARCFLMEYNALFGC